MFSPFLREPFAQAIEDGLIPPTSRRSAARGARSTTPAS